MSGPLLDRVEGLLAEAAEHLGAIPELEAARRRLREPLRVAIAGRMKAGKSTLLNALVGERLAATDAGECTRHVTWYRHDLGYDVRAVMRDGNAAPLPFERGSSSVMIDLVGVEQSRIRRLEVRWPASRLEDMLLIDTPGLGSSRLEDAPVEIEPTEADAVVYLMRHLHRTDVDFLEAFGDHTLAHPSPATAIGVLSRADEIGGGRLGALESAAAIAGRYSADDQVRSLCTTVVPVAGLLGESAAVLREDEVTALRTMQGMPEPELDELLLSADRFIDPSRSSVPAQTRRRLFDLLGMFGIRLSLSLLRSDPDLTAAGLAGELRARSGIGHLEMLLDRHFRNRADALKAHSAITALRTAVRSASNSAAAAHLARSIEALWAGTEEFAEFRLWDLIAAGAVEFDGDELEEVRRLAPGATAAARLGLDGGADDAAISERALAGITEWRQRADHPLTGRRQAEAFLIVARWYEGIYGALHRA